MSSETNRPNIPKMRIVNIGGFDESGLPKGWRFDGKGIENTVGQYVDDHWYLAGGYTIDELKEIARQVVNPQH